MFFILLGKIYAICVLIAVIGYGLDSVRKKVFFHKI